MLVIIFWYGFSYQSWECFLLSTWYWSFNPRFPGRGRGGGGREGELALKQHSIYLEKAKFERKNHFGLSFFAFLSITLSYHIDISYYNVPFSYFLPFSYVYMHIVTLIPCWKKLFDPTKVHILHFRPNFSEKNLCQGTGNVSRAHLSQKTYFRKFEKNRKKSQLFQKLPLRHPSPYELREHTKIW